MCRLKTISLIIACSIFVSSPLLADAKDSGSIDYIVMGEHLPPLPSDISPYLGQVLDGIKPGTDLRLVDLSTSDVLGEISIPTDPRFERSKILNREFAGPIGRFEAALVQRLKAENTPDTGLDDIPRFIRRFSLVRRNTKGLDAHVLMFVDPVFTNATDQRLNMVSTEGQIQIPTDRFLVEDTAVSPYGNDYGTDQLANTFFHICAASATDLHPWEFNKIKHLWANFLRARGATVSSFSNVPDVCFGSYAAKETESIEIAPLNSEAPLTMQRLARLKDVPVVDVEPTDEWLEKYYAKLADAERKAAETLRRAESLEADLAEAEWTNAQVSSELASCSAELEQLRPRVLQSSQLDELDSVSIFKSVTHPSRPEISIMTGVSFAPPEFPNRFQSSWCYFTTRDESNLLIRTDLGEKSPGSRVDWESHAPSNLTKLGFGKRFMNEARQACRFPNG